MDLSRRPVATTRVDSVLHRAGITVHRGDLFAPVHGRRSGLVIANPPYVPASTAALPRHRMARCWDAGRDGRSLLDRVCAGAHDVLQPDGMLLLVHSTVCDVDATVDLLGQHGLTAKVLRRAVIPFGPVMRARAATLEDRGMIHSGQDTEELVVIGARRG